MQIVQIIGHIGQDAKLKTDNGRTALNFSVAVTKKLKYDDGRPPKDVTNWYSCYSTQTNLAEYLKQGTQVFVQGDFSVNTYKNKDQVIVAGLNINCKTIQLLSGKKDSTQGAGQSEQQSSAPQAPEPALIADEDGVAVPF